MYPRRIETKTMLAVAVTFFVAAGQGRAMAGEASSESDSKWLWSVSGSAGFGSGADNQFGDNIAVTGGVTAMKGHHLIGARYAIVDQFCFGDCNSFWDVGLMYGLVAHNPVGIATLSAGLSTTGGTRFEDFDFLGGIPRKTTYTTVGIPIEAKLTWTLGSHVGLSAGGFADVNLEKSFGGFTFGLSLGRLR